MERNASKKATEIQYPLLSKIISYNDEFSLQNPKVEVWARSALSEVARLYHDAGLDMKISTLHDREIWLLPISLLVESKYDIPYLKVLTKCSKIGMLTCCCANSGIAVAS